MKSIINYIEKYGDITIKEKSIGEVDYAILSVLSYLNFDGIIYSNLTKVKLGDAVKSFFDKYPEEVLENNGVGLKDSYTIAKSLIDKKGYCNLELYNYVYELDETIQFSAMFINIDKDNIFISIEGTDDEVVGWKEDFQLSYQFPIPAQRKCRDYLNKYISLFSEKKYIISGHSKGGNLAVYASSKTFFFNQLRIKKIFSHDGPGFLEEFLKSKKYHFIRNKIDKTIPSTSIVGTLFYSDEPYRVIKASGIGPAQHTPVNWLVERDEFVYLDDTSKMSKRFDSAITNWLDSLTIDERISFVNSLYKALSDNNFDALNITEKKYFKIYSSFRKSIKDLDENHKQMIMEILKRLTFNDNKNSNDN